MDTEQIPSREGVLPHWVARMAAGDSVRIACYGNSITYGMMVGDPRPDWMSYPMRLQELLRERFGNDGIEVLNCGTPGFTAPMALQAVDTAVIGKEPDLCILMLGINDCLNGIRPGVFGSTMEKVVDALEEGQIDVMLMSPTPILLPGNEDLQAYRKQVEIVSLHKKTAFLDMHHLILERAKRDKIPLAQLLPDLVHFSQDRYRLIGEEIDVFWGGMVSGQ